MPRLFVVLLATSLAGADFAGAEGAPISPSGLRIAQPIPIVQVDFDQTYPYRHHDWRAWRRYPPGYGVETGPAFLGVVVGGLLTNPCFSGGCYYDPRDACYPGHSCSGSWGGVTAADERSILEAYRAISRQAAKAAVSPVMIEPGSRAARHGARKQRLSHDQKQP
jgi:hypothetical protein